MAIEKDRLIPAARHDDDEDVAWALKTAATLWNRGDHIDGLDWLRRAAKAAAESGQDDRALEISKAVAEASTHSVRPPAPAPAPSSPLRGKTGSHKQGSADGTGRHKVKQGASTAVPKPVAAPSKSGTAQASRQNAAAAPKPQNSVAPSAPKPATNRPPPAPADPAGGRASPLPAAPRSMAPPPIPGSSFPPPRTSSMTASIPPPRPSTMPRPNSVLPSNPLPRPSTLPRAGSIAPPPSALPSTRIVPAAAKSSGLPVAFANMTSPEEDTSQVALPSPSPEFDDAGPPTAVVSAYTGRLPAAPAATASPTPATANAVARQAVAVHLVRTEHGVTVTLAGPGTAAPDGATEVLLVALAPEIDLLALLTRS